MNPTMRRVKPSMIQNAFSLVTGCTQTKTILKKIILKKIGLKATNLSFYRFPLQRASDPFLDSLLAQLQSVQL